MNHETLKTYLGQPEYADLSDADALDALSALTIEQPRQYVFGSFRTLASLLTGDEYNVLRGAFKAAVAAEATAGGSLYGDMERMLLLPGDEGGSGGGLDLGNDAVAGAIAALCVQAELPDVPGKIAAYCQSYQPTPRKVFPGLQLSDIEIARGTRPLVQQEAN